jgi:protein TonB
MVLAKAVRADPLAAPTASGPAKPVEFIRIGLQTPRPSPAPPKGLGPTATKAKLEGVRPAAAIADEPAGSPQAAGPPDVDAEVTVGVGARAEAPEASPTPIGPSAELIALVHQKLSIGAARCYPPAAQRFRQQGTVTVAFCATPSGEIKRIAIEHSSGSALLDTAASDCVVPSANPLPTEAAGACFVLPVRFGQP